MDKNIKFFYLRDSKNRPYGVLIMRVGAASIDISYSFCSEKDKFSKKIAREKALQRLNNQKYYAPIRKLLFKKINTYTINKTCLKHFIGGVWTEEPWTDKVPTKIKKQIDKFINPFWIMTYSREN